VIRAPLNNRLDQELLQPLRYPDFALISSRISYTDGEEPDEFTLLKRGVNQSEDFARNLAEIAGINFLNDKL
jgi:hypothetical protein